MNATLKTDPNLENYPNRNLCLNRRKAWLMDDHLSGARRAFGRQGLREIGELPVTELRVMQGLRLGKCYYVKVCGVYEDPTHQKIMIAFA